MFMSCLVRCGDRYKVTKGVQFPKRQYWFELIRFEEHSFTNILKNYFDDNVRGQNILQEDILIMISPDQTPSWEDFWISVSCFVRDLIFHKLHGVVETFLKILYNHFWTLPFFFLKWPLAIVFHFLVEG